MELVYLTPIRRFRRSCVLRLFLTVLIRIGLLLPSFILLLLLLRQTRRNLNRNLHISRITLAQNMILSKQETDQQKKKKAKINDDIYRCIITAVIHTHRSIIHQPDLHHSLEHSILNPLGIIV